MTERTAPGFHPRSLVRGIEGSIIGASALVGLDVAFAGTYLLSLFFCPIWFVLSVAKNAIERPGWRVALLRIAIPVLTLSVALGNNALQLRIARTNADRVINACMQFRADNGVYPSDLGELVPRYLLRIPRAKYCLSGDFGRFKYYSDPSDPCLVWTMVPPFYRAVYSFRTGKWSSMD